MGIELIYTVQNKSLAIAEVAVHFTLATLRDDYMMIAIYIPDEVEVKPVDEKKLPSDWKDFPHPSSTQKIGYEFVMENKYGVLRLPSVVTQGEFKVLINPHHQDFNNNAERDFNRRISALLESTPAYTF